MSGFALPYRKNSKKLGLEMEDLQEILMQMEAKSEKDQALHTKVKEIQDKIERMDNSTDGVRTSLRKLLVEKESVLETVNGKSPDEVESIAN